MVNCDPLPPALSAMQTANVKESDPAPVPVIDCKGGVATEPPMVDKHFSPEAVKSPDLPDGPQNISIDAAHPLSQTAASDSTIARNSPGPVEYEDTESAALNSPNSLQSGPTQKDVIGSPLETMGCKTLNAENSSSPDIIKQGSENVERPSPSTEEKEEGAAAEKLRKKTTFSNE
ncbi:hypothetical protein CRG98_034656, partial [Punica granatum]